MILAMLNPLLRKVVQGAGRMLKKPASFVLAALRGSTYRSVRLASSLAAASLDGLFEHPARKNLAVPDVRAIEFQERRNSFFAVC
jgi:hypothetical protein